MRSKNVNNEDFATPVIDWYNEQVDKCQEIAKTHKRFSTLRLLQPLFSS